MARPCLSHPSQYVYVRAHYRRRPRPTLNPFVCENVCNAFLASALRSYKQRATAEWYRRRVALCRRPANSPMYRAR